MRLTCPNCDAQYEVADNVIPDEGRDVQCSNCGTTWFQEPASALAAAARRATAPDPADNAPPPDEPDKAEDPAAEDLSEDAATEASEDVTGDGDAVEAGAEQDAGDEGLKPASSVSDDAASILRDEAMRELRARLSEDPSLEMQADLGLEEPPAAHATAGDGAEETTETAPTDGTGVTRDRETAAAVADVVASNRDLLPDIEEINSTLTATSDRKVRELREATGKGGRSRRRLGFRIGFVGAVVVAVAAVGLYVYAPFFVDRFPASGPAIYAYVSQTDAARIWLDSWVMQTVQSLTQVMSAAVSDR